MRTPVSDAWMPELKSNFDISVIRLKLETSKDTVIYVGFVCVCVSGCVCGGLLKYRLTQFNSGKFLNWRL